jgi:hypothetical protein
MIRKKLQSFYVAKRAVTWSFYSWFYTLNSESNLLIYTFIVRVYNVELSFERSS